MYSRVYLRVLAHTCAYLRILAYTCELWSGLVVDLLVPDTLRSNGGCNQRNFPPQESGTSVVSGFCVREKLRNIYSGITTSCRAISFNFIQFSPKICQTRHHSGGSVYSLALATAPPIPYLWIPYSPGRNPAPYNPLPNKMTHACLSFQS